eukprot:scaffold23682_cov17-Tisochrysis_lutea.AAC.5
MVHRAEIHPAQTLGAYCKSAAFNTFEKVHVQVSIKVTRRRHMQRILLSAFCRIAAIGVFADINCTSALPNGNVWRRRAPLFPPQTGLGVITPLTQHFLLLFIRSSHVADYVCHHLCCVQALWDAGQVLEAQVTSQSVRSYSNHGAPGKLYDQKEPGCTMRKRNKERNLNSATYAPRGLGIHCSSL